jgi:hypothetical protein
MEPRRLQTVVLSLQLDLSVEGVGAELFHEFVGEAEDEQRGSPLADEDARVPVSRRLERCGYRD